jgi:hypothetical protein
VAGEITPVGSGKLIVPKEDYTNLQFFIKLNRSDVKDGRK